MRSILLSFRNRIEFRQRASPELPLRIGGRGRFLARRRRGAALISPGALLRLPPPQVFSERGCETGAPSVAAGVSGVICAHFVPSRTVGGLLASARRLI